MALPNESKCIVGGTGQDSGERSERTRRAESWLGEPTKQNGDESRARLGAAALFAFAGHNMYGPPQSCKRKLKMTIWSAPMYSAFVGVSDSWP